MSKATAAQRALERAVEEETKSIRDELAASQAEVRALHTVLSKIAGIAFEAGAKQAPLALGASQVTLPAELAAAAAPPPPEEPIWHEAPIDLAPDDGMGPGRFV